MHRPTASYNSHHATKSPHLGRVIALSGFNYKNDDALVTLACTRADKRYARTHPSQDIEEWSKYFNPKNIYAINRNEAMRRDVAKYHPGAYFFKGEAVEQMVGLARAGVVGMYYLDMMCTFDTIMKDKNLQTFFDIAQSGTVIIVNCMFYASVRKKGQVSDVPERTQYEVISKFCETFKDLPNWEYVGKDFYQSDSHVRTPMMSIIFRRK
jgi:hypothetical protein